MFLAEQEAAINNAKNKKPATMVVDNTNNDTGEAGRAYQKKWEGKIMPKSAEELLKQVATRGAA